MLGLLAASVEREKLLVVHLRVQVGERGVRRVRVQRVRKLLLLRSQIEATSVLTRRLEENRLAQSLGHY